LAGYHVNTQLPKILSAARLYELAGDQRYRTAVNFLWDRVVNTRSMAPGGVDLREHFYEAGDESAHLAWNSSETCSVYNMLKLTRSVFSWNPSAATMDYYERALYNQILGSQDPDSGGMTYFYCLKPGHFKIYSTPFDAMWCCVGSGIENHSKYADTIYSHNDDTLWVNLFIPSLLDWQEKDLRVRMETKFPADETVNLTINTGKSQEFDLKVRVPYWATSGAEVTINGEKQNVKSTPESYLTLSRQWKDGDKIAVRLPMSLHLRPARDKENLITIMYGPVVLAGEFGTQGMPNDVSPSQSAHSGAMDPPVPVLLVDADKDPSSWVKRVPGETLRFKTVGAGKPNDVTLIPLADLHHQRYTVYWETMAPGDWQPAPSLKPEEIAESELTPGLDYRYFEGAWVNLPDFSKLEVKKTGTVENFGLSVQGQRDNFGIVFSGYLKIAEKGEYIFATPKRRRNPLHPRWQGACSQRRNSRHDLRRLAVRSVIPRFLPPRGRVLRGGWWRGTRELHLFPSRWQLEPNSKVDALPTQVGLGKDPGRVLQPAPRAARRPRRPDRANAAFAGTSFASFDESTPTDGDAGWVRLRCSGKTPCDLGPAYDEKYGLVPFPVHEFLLAMDGRPRLCRAAEVSTPAKTGSIGASPSCVFHPVLHKKRETHQVETALAGLAGRLRRKK
jgi:hypothetical protein